MFVKGNRPSQTTATKRASQQPSEPVYGSYFRHPSRVGEGSGGGGGGGLREGESWGGAGAAGLLSNMLCSGHSVIAGRRCAGRATKTAGGERDMGECKLAAR